MFLVMQEVKQRGMLLYAVYIVLCLAKTRSQYAYVTNQAIIILIPVTHVLNSRAKVCEFEP